MRRQSRDQKEITPTQRLKAKSSESMTVDAS